MFSSMHPNILSKLIFAGVSTGGAGISLVNKVVVQTQLIEIKMIFPLIAEMIERPLGKSYFFNDVCKVKNI